MKFVILLFGLLISLASLGQKVIKGIVCDRIGPISGALVKELGTNEELITNEKGEFNLHIETTNPIILVTAYGHRFRTIKIKDETLLKIKLRRQKHRDIAKRGDKGTMPFNNAFVAMFPGQIKYDSFSQINIAVQLSKNLATFCQ